MVVGSDISHGIISLHTVFNTIRSIAIIMNTNNILLNSRIDFLLVELGELYRTGQLSLADMKEYKALKRQADRIEFNELQRIERDNKRMEGGE